MNLDKWELSTTSDAQSMHREMWQKLIGHDAENPDETDTQTSIILAGIQPGHRALEVGAGCGRLVKAVSQSGRFEQVAGVDSSVSMTLMSEHYLAMNGSEGRVALGDGMVIPFPDAHFDFVWSLTVLQHQPSLAMVHRMLAEIARVLVPGGLCRLQTVAAVQVKEGVDPADPVVFDGRVMKDEWEFAERVELAGLQVLGVAVGLTHPTHVWVTGRKAL